MRPLRSVLSLGSVVILAYLCLSGCAGGGGASMMPYTAPSVAPAASSAAGANASGKIIIAVPPMVANASRARRAEYVSPGTTRAAAFIDGATTPAGQTTSCTSSACTIAWSAVLSVPASHRFAVEVDNGTSVLAEGAQSYAIVFGNNGTLSTLTLSGVAASGAISGETCTTSSCSGTLTIADAAGYTIVNTSTPHAAGLDNGPLTFSSTATGVGTVTAAGSTTITQPTASGTVAYTATCVSSTGSFFSTLSAASTTGSGAITSGELSALAVTYPASITFVSNAYTCQASAAISNFRIYIGQNAHPGFVNVYAGGASGSAPAVATIVGGSTGISFPVGVAFDSGGRLYVANHDANTVTVYAANPIGNVTGAPVATIGGGSTGVNGPYGVSIGPTGRVFIANNTANDVLVFPANPVGNVTSAPVATIGGGSTGISSPYRVAFDGAGQVYVENYASSGGTITVFPANPIGSVTTAPVATIGGGSTAINGPVGLALDASGRVYVNNNGSSSVTVYAANPMGSVTAAPVATIVTNNGIVNPLGLTLDAAGRVYVANYGNSNILVFAANPTGNVTAGPVQTISGVTGVFGIGVH